MVPNRIKLSTLNSCVFWKYQFHQNITSVMIWLTHKCWWPTLECLLINTDHSAKANVLLPSSFLRVKFRMSAERRFLFTHHERHFSKFHCVATQIWMLCNHHPKIIIIIFNQWPSIFTLCCYAGYSFWTQYLVLRVCPWNPKANLNDKHLFISK